MAFDFAQFKQTILSDKDVKVPQELLFSPSNLLRHVAARPEIKEYLALFQEGDAKSPGSDQFVWEKAWREYRKRRWKFDDAAYDRIAAWCKRNAAALGKKEADAFDLLAYCSAYMNNHYELANFSILKSLKVETRILQQAGILASQEDHERLETKAAKNPVQNTPKNLDYEEFLGALEFELSGMDHIAESLAAYVVAHQNRILDARPLSLIFAGPAQSGQDEAAEILAKCSGRKLFPYSMGRYTDEKSPEALLGKANGDDSDRSPFIADLQNDPYAIFFFQQSHVMRYPALSSLLGMIRTGEIVDVHGNKVDATKAIFIFDSCYKTEQALRADNNTPDKIAAAYRSHVQTWYGADFLTRSVLFPFYPLNQDGKWRMLQRRVAGINQQLAEKGVRLMLDESCRAPILAKVETWPDGVTNINQVFEDCIRLPLMIGLSKKKFDKKGVYKITVHPDGRTCLAHQPDALPLSAAKHPRSSTRGGR